MKIKDTDIVQALKDSAAVEVSADGKKVRRKDNKPVPELTKKRDDTQKKRDAKAAEKEENKKANEEDEAEPELDERGNPILVNADFENP